MKYDPKEFNYSYYPIIFETEAKMHLAVETLNADWVYPRRYFCPSLNNIDYVSSGPMPVSEDISRRIICLPLYYDLTNEEIDFVCRLLLRAQNN